MHEWDVIVQDEHKQCRKQIHFSIVRMKGGHTLDSRAHQQSIPILLQSQCVPTLMVTANKPVTAIQEQIMVDHTLNNRMKLALTSLHDADLLVTILVGSLSLTSNTNREPSWPEANSTASSCDSVSWVMAEPQHLNSWNSPFSGYL